jgi:hypothetical protein
MGCVQSEFDAAIGLYGKPAKLLRPEPAVVCPWFEGTPLLVYMPRGTQDWLEKLELITSHK